MSAGSFVAQRALSNGGALVRLFYLDESGKSNTKNDPHFVVASVGVHGDSQYRALVDRIIGLRNECFPEGAPEGFYFHATEIYSGGKFFARDKWPTEKRHSLLTRLSEIIQDFQLPVFISYLDRKEFRVSLDGALPPGRRAEEIFRGVEHAICLCFCEISMEKWLKVHAPNELAVLVEEDFQSTKEYIRSTHADLRKNSAPTDPRFRGSAAHLPLSRTIDTLNFADKANAPLLQLADLCAFYGKKFLAQDQRAMRLLSCLDSQVAEISAWSPS